MLKTVAGFIVLLAFIGCDRVQRPLADVVKASTIDETPTSDPSEEPLIEAPRVSAVPDNTPEPPVVTSEQTDNYASVDAAFENADVIADASGDPGLFFLSGNFHTLISAELGVPYTLEIDSEVAGAYREAMGLLRDAEVSREETAREYLKLRLEFPEETHAEIMERLKQFYKSGLQPSP